MASPATLDILSDLVAFPTVSRDSNLDLIAYCVDYLAGLGVRAEVIEDPSGRKANLLATVGAGPGPGLILSGHTDVVPVDGQAWSSDPFRLRVADGKAFGRGAADMKGFLACVLAAVPRMLAAELREPFLLAFSYDEEVGCTGVRSLIERLRGAARRPAGCIVGEPTDMRVVVGHKSGEVYKCTVRGKAAHSSLAPLAVNAVEYAARLVVHISELSDRLSREERRHAGFDVPHSTLQTGVIQGGAAPNIVPDECWFKFDTRCLPWTSSKDIVASVEAYARNELLPRMRDLHPEAAIEIERLGHVPGFETPKTSALSGAISRLLGRSVEDSGYVAFGTEAGLFDGIDIPSVVCGPGSIEQAHRPDEFVTLQSLGECDVLLEKIIVTQSHEFIDMKKLRQVPLAR